ncbi:VOC family protein [Lewinella sp. JB7]|uniref:VOC family protein n=1 Tax=Lewinella sp. JB7 TaxID=2962887 RepID=UPI0020CA22D8|nr:VOC family protein [Lewinella sp. JB7]MCP9237511.1 VOC family protein [Lewinella sp. JB7]
MLDHLVYCVPDLEEATERFSLLGLSPSVGGRHPDRGTHNCLLRLGPRSYLELLAPDPAATVAPPRWMGIDLLNGPTVSRWAVNAGADIITKAKLLGKDTRIQTGERRLPNGDTLRWRLTDPGTHPAVSVLPFLIDWGGAQAVHPTDALPDVGLRLTELRLYHPTPESLTPLLAALATDAVAVSAPVERIEITLRGPAGEFRL